MENRLNIKENYDSQNLYEKIMILPEKEKEKIKNGLDFIENSCLHMVLIGGTALVHHLEESRDLTPDIDFLVPDMDKLIELLDRKNIRHSYLINGLGIVVDEYNTDFIDSKANNEKLNQVILSTPNEARIAGYSLKIISPELLFLMKMETSRDKDLDDAISILKSGILNKHKFLKYCLRGHDSLVAFAEMM